MSVFYETKSGKIINADNIEALKEIDDNSIDSCISDFPYAIEFMGKNWDSAKHWNNGEGIHGQFTGTGYSGKRRPAFYLNTNEDGIKFYDWCFERAQELMRVMKPGGYVAIFGHPKMNHRMKCAFDDAGFNIVEEIDWLYLCVSSDTSILTKQGWKYYDQVTDDDYVMTLNTEANKCEWQKIDAVHVYNYSGAMHSIKTCDTDQLVTPNHRILYKHKLRKMISGKMHYYTGDYEYAEAQNIVPKYGINLPLAARYDGSVRIGGAMAYLIGFILGDGMYHKDCDAISIYQTSSKMDNVNKIRGLLTYLGIKFSEYVREYSYTDKIDGLSRCRKKEYIDNYIKKHEDDTYVQYQFYISVDDSKKIRNLIPNIDLSLDMLEWCYEDRLQLVMGLIDSDGSTKVTKNGTEYYQFWQKDLKFREIFQIICFSLGFKTSWNERKFGVGVSKNSFTQIRSKYFSKINGKKCLPSVEYDGIVWCVSTKNTNFVARRNNKVFITGNSGMPKCQDVGKLYDRKVGAEREVIETRKGSTGSSVNNHETMFDDDAYEWSGEYDITKPATEFSKKWNDWKTDGLKPAHEPITIFKKPMVGTYIENIEQYGCGAMNIGSCRVPISKEDIDMINAKSSKNPTTNYSDREDKVYGKFSEDRASEANVDGRFPPNVVFDEFMAKELDSQTGITKSSGGSGEASTKNRARHIYGAFNQEQNENYQNDSLGGYGDVGGGSRLFPIFKYCPKVSPSERKLPSGKRNPHVTLKPKELIKWLIKLLTPIEGTTIDITAGSCTHAVACEELNLDENYKLKYIDIELCNDAENPYCDVGRERVEAVVNSIRKNRLF